VRLLTTDIFKAVTQVPPRLGYGSAFAVMMTVVVAGLLALYLWLMRRADRFASMTGKGFRPQPFDLGRLKWVGSGVVLLHFAFAFLIPMLGLLWMSLMPFARPVSVAGLSSITFENYAAVFHQDSYWEMARNTIVISAAAATLAIAATLFAAWLLIRKWPGAQALDYLLTLPLVIPGTVLGVALIAITLRTPLPLYGTLWVIGVAFFIRFLPYSMRYAYAGVLQIHRELEEAAGASGATQVGILRRIVVPLLAPALLAAWLFAFLLGSKDLSMSVLLAGAHSKTMAVGMYDSLQNGQAGESSALGILWTILMTAIATILYLVGRRTSNIQAVA
jgi:iron(III) transport system permease protein